MTTSHATAQPTPGLTMSDDSDTMPLEGDTPLTPTERKALRRLLREDERATWAWKKLRVLVPAGVTAVVALWQGWEWVSRHIRWAP